MSGALALAGKFVASLAILLAGAWGALALRFQAPGSEAVKLVAAIAWAALALAAAVLVWRSAARYAVPGFTIAFALLLAWWVSLAPAGTRAWADDVAHLATGTVDGDIVTLHAVRDFDWRTKDDYTPRWEPRRYDLAHLASTDVILSYWAGEWIAHTLVSFGFDDGSHVVFSVEIRREAHERFSEIGGFFKQFELSVIAADERDIVRVRTNVRGEDDYLYRLQLDPDARRALFLAYVDEANRLARDPRWYHTVTANCTTLVYHMARQILGGGLPMDYRVLLSGYLDRYLYDIGGLDRNLPFDTLRTQARITDRARAADRSATFSADIRAGMSDAKGTAGR
ncbi:Lnb N-terminal periplasmic domain-containing protein [Dokdonella sp. MW10]|uniref:Lnb N-terminal periplasmic domain-containing protein n=1 Tax=Dokdonella sp. MW10 TaxID=2992926 RepID=UPI003F7F3779